MLHNSYNKDFEFVVNPEPFNKYTDRDFLQYCLGGTLYMPGTQQIFEKVCEHKLRDVASIVMCLEDACKEEDLPMAEANIRKHLDGFNEKIGKGDLSVDDLPLIFVRVRNPDHFKSFAATVTKEEAHLLSGFVFPKFNSGNAQDYLSVLYSLTIRLDELVYGMPILEGREIAYSEKRVQEMLLLRNILKPYKDIILNIRVGGTDMSSLFGLRRSISSPIYDIRTISNALSDILNFFNRELEYVVSGPVWEYFAVNRTEDIDASIKKNLQHALNTRVPIINEAIDGLLRETFLDKTNGFVGKTIIHPSHARFVNAMYAVTKEEYDDAVQIFNTSGGVVKSSNANKMNEIGPHRRWATKVIYRAKAYGVVKDESSYFNLLGY
jgi:citrate lyase beta subunit